MTPFEFFTCLFYACVLWLLVDISDNLEEINAELKEKNK